jgi:hypothetical protein
LPGTSSKSDFMNKRHVLAALLLGLCAGMQAQLQFDSLQNEHEAGFTEEKRVAVFTFKNTGSEPVRILKVSSSCGCTVPKMDKKVYQPGESGRIEAVFTYGGRMGIQRKRITVKTSGGGDQTHLLTMVTDIPAWVEVSPRLLRWKTTESSKTQALAVHVAQPERIEIEIPESSEHFNISWKESSPGKYAILLEPKALSGRVTEFLTIRASVREGEKTRTREFGAHCLIR